MAKKINDEWQRKMLERIDNRGSIDETTNYLPAVQWLIQTLSQRNMLYKVHQLGAGVRRVTTDTDVCPCCRRKLTDPVA